MPETKTNLDIARERLSAFEASVKEELAADELEEAKKKKKPYDSATVTTGNIGYNIDQWNKHHGTYFGNDNGNPSTEEAKAAAKAAENATQDLGGASAGDGTPAASGGESSAGAGDAGASTGDGGASGGMGESFQRAINEALEEAKLFIPKLARAKGDGDPDINRATIDIPDNINILPINQVEYEIEKLSPEEPFTVGYITPVYFYDDLWDKFMLVKCTTFTGYTGMDYRDVRALDDQGAEYAGHTDRIEKSITQMDNPHIDANRHVKRIDSQTPKEYAKINKLVNQGDIVYHGDNGTVEHHIENHTILYYPDFTKKPSVVYYINMYNGKGYFKVSRTVLEETIIAYVESLLTDPNFKKTNRWDTARLRGKIQKTLDMDYATQADTVLSAQKVWEPTANNGRVNKPQVRALYTGQIFYLETANVTLGKPLKEGLEEDVLDEAKRETRRYYVRPQNIFCANKADVIRALIAIGDENCSVYSLKGLDDNRDVHKLTNNDIIYYYDDGILYDKNHVKVMDYDLYIKHEEERKKFPGDANNVSGATFIDAYDDRITDITGPGLEDQVKESVDITADSLLEVLENNAESAGIFENLDEYYVENPFEQTFEDYDVYGDKVDLTEDADKHYICCICGEECTGYGNNPEPVKHEGKCCDACNIKFVIPARLDLAKSDEDKGE